jgi:biotin synthase
MNLPSRSMQRTNANVAEKWDFDKAYALFSLPFSELLYQAQTVFRTFFPEQRIQISTLLSIKTGGCPENCSYCPQSAHYQTDLPKEPLMALSAVLEAAQRAKDGGSTRFCMGAAWRGPRDADLDKVCEMVREVKKLGLETCVTLGLLKQHQAVKLKEAGLDFYNHNIDTSPSYYEQVITTRTFGDRLETLTHVRDAGLNVCCGGIVGMGESNSERVEMLVTLANLPEPPQSVPINQLIRIPGTPLEGVAAVDPFDFVRLIALARVMMPRSTIRLSAGREQMSDELQALCFVAGANSLFYGEKLLTAANPVPEKDQALFQRLGLQRDVL